LIALTSNISIKYSHNLRLKATISYDRKRLMHSFLFRDEYDLRLEKHVITTFRIVKKNIESQNLKVKIFIKSKDELFGNSFCYNGSCSNMRMNSNYLLNNS
jgi:hypothetical protein